MEVGHEAKPSKVDIEPLQNERDLEEESVKLDEEIEEEIRGMFARSV